MIDWFRWHVNLSWVISYPEVREFHSLFVFIFFVQLFPMILFARGYVVSSILSQTNNFLNSSTWLIDGTLTQVQSGPGSNGNEKVNPHSPDLQNWSLTIKFSLGSNRTLFMGRGSYSSAGGIQSIYSKFCLLEKYMTSSFFKFWNASLILFKPF